MVYAGLHSDSVMFQVQYVSDKRINLLFDKVTQQHVIANFAGAMAKCYVCEACNKRCNFGAVYYAMRSVATV